MSVCKKTALSRRGFIQMTGGSAAFLTLAGCDIDWDDILGGGHGDDGNSDLDTTDPGNGDDTGFGQDGTAPEQACYCQQCTENRINGSWHMASTDSPFYDHLKESYQCEHEKFAFQF